MVKSNLFSEKLQRVRWRRTIWSWAVLRDLPLLPVLPLWYIVQCDCIDLESVKSGWNLLKCLKSMIRNQEGSVLGDIHRHVSLMTLWHYCLFAMESTGRSWIPLTKRWVIRSFDICCWMNGKVAEDMPYFKAHVTSLGCIFQIYHRITIYLTSLKFGGAIAFQQIIKHHGHKCVPTR